MDTQNRLVPTIYRMAQELFQFPGFSHVRGVYLMTYLVFAAVRLMPIFLINAEKLFPKLVSLWNPDEDQFLTIVRSLILVVLKM